MTSSLDRNAPLGGRIRALEARAERAESVRDELRQALAARNHELVLARNAMREVGEELARRYRGQRTMDPSTCRALASRLSSEEGKTR